MPENSYHRVVLFQFKGVCKNCRCIVSDVSLLKSKLLQIKSSLCEGLVTLHEM